MDRAKRLKTIKSLIRFKETSELSRISGVNVSVVSMYLNHADKIVLNDRKADRIIKAWNTLAEKKYNNY
jgi:hypothetical protein